MKICYEVMIAQYSEWEENRSNAIYYNFHVEQSISAKRVQYLRWRNNNVNNILNRGIDG